MHKGFWIERIEEYGVQYVGDKRHNKKEHDDFYNRKRDFIKGYIPEHTKVLDYGCGVGMYADLFDKSKYLGVDIVKCDHPFYDDYNFRLIELFEPIPDKVDLVICLNVLQHIKDFEKAIATWDIDKGHILLMENVFESNDYTFARSMWNYIDAIKLHFKVMDWEYTYIEGCNVLIKCVL